MWLHIFATAWLLGWSTTACAILKTESNVSWESQGPGLIVLIFVWPVVT
jgi:hypothetical protein